MPIAPESIKVGECYLDARYRVLHVTHVTPDSRVRFKYQDAHSTMIDVWWAEMLNLREFASQTLRQVPCGWRPEEGGELERFLTSAFLRVSLLRT